jgi:hypothetical protein
MFSIVKRTSKKKFLRGDERQTMSTSAIMQYARGCFAIFSARHSGINTLEQLNNDSNHHHQQPPVSPGGYRPFN